LDVDWVGGFVDLGIERATSRQDIERLSLAYGASGVKYPDAPNAASGNDTEARRTWNLVSVDGGSARLSTRVRPFAVLNTVFH
jgi:hypothetical protein